MIIHRISLTTALSTLLTFGGSCGGEVPQMMPPMATMCVELGALAKTKTECCAQGNLSLDLNDLSRCCTGKSCCSTKNHSHSIENMKCVCDTGYEWVDPDDMTNVICKKLPPPPSLPDLAVTEASITYFPYTNSNVWMCFNESPPGGTPMSGPNHVTVQNRGNKDSGPYEVDIGIIDQNNRYVTCLAPLRATTGTRVGKSTTWSSGCCRFQYVIPGRYRTYVKADTNDSALESDESNNVYVSPTTVFVIN